MAYYYKIDESHISNANSYKGFHLHKEKENTSLGPSINYDFSKHVLIELLDDVTPESQLWEELGLIQNKSILHKRMMVDSHRLKCRRAIVICINSDEAKKIAQHLSQAKIMRRVICAVVVEELLSDLSLFEKQIKDYGDNRSQQQLLYVTDLNRCREPSGLVNFLREKFSQFGTILSILVSADKDGYAYPEGVIRFAYLSEAFAAEIAYDQYVIGMERLSVTTHHNILLSECDLRVRLREAVWNLNSPNYDQSNSSLNACKSFNEPILTNCVKNVEINARISDIHENKMFDKVNNVNPFHGLNQSKVFIDDNRSFSFTADKNETLRNVSQTNWCLKSMTLCSEKETFDVKMVNNNLTTSFDKCKESNDMLCENALTFNESDMSEATILPHNRILEWISSLPDDGTFTDNINTSENPSCNEVLTFSENGIKNFNSYNMYTIEEDPTENNSTTGSYVSCDNADQGSSYFTPVCKKSEAPRQSFTNKNLSQKHVILHTKKCLSSFSSGVKTDSTHERRTFSDSRDTKKFVTSSQKLSLRKQRSGSSLSEVSAGTSCFNVTKKLGFVSNSSILNLYTTNDEFHELNSGNKENTNSLQFSVSKSSKKHSLSPLKSTRRSSRLKMKKLSSVPDEDSIKIPDITTSLHEIANVERKSSMKPLRIENDARQRSLNECTNSIIGNTSKQTVDIEFEDETMTPLKLWLKKELKVSYNNRITKSEEDSKSIIVCATMKKDVIISVGCSHVTCEYCYPQSTNLLLGYS